MISQIAVLINKRILCLTHLEEVAACLQSYMQSPYFQNKLQYRRLYELPIIRPPPFQIDLNLSSYRLYREERLCRRQWIRRRGQARVARDTSDAKIAGLLAPVPATIVSRAGASGSTSSANDMPNVFLATAPRKIKIHVF